MFLEHVCLHENIVPDTIRMLSPDPKLICLLGICMHSFFNYQSNDFVTCTGESFQMVKD